MMTTRSFAVGCAAVLGLLAMTARPAAGAPLDLLTPMEDMVHAYIGADAGSSDLSNPDAEADVVEDAPSLTSFKMPKTGLIMTEDGYYLAISDTKADDKRDDKSGYLCAVNNKRFAAVFEFVPYARSPGYKIRLKDNKLRTRQKGYGNGWMITSLNEKESDRFNDWDLRAILAPQSRFDATVETPTFELMRVPCPCEVKHSLQLRYASGSQQVGPARNYYVTVPWWIPARDTTSKYVTLNEELMTYMKIVAP